jgi:hypothetical protein
MANRDFSFTSPSITQSALKILCRQCSELAWANIISSTSVGGRAQGPVGLGQVIDLLVGEGEAHLRIGPAQGRPGVIAQLDHPHRRGLVVQEQALRLGEVEQHGFGHAVMEQPGQPAPDVRIQG